MKLAHILPVGLLELNRNRGFHMCLANIANKNKDYLDFYKQRRLNNEFVLLDNGAAEQDQMNLDIMIKMIHTINPNEVILNDVLLNKEQTLIKSKESLNFYESHNLDIDYMFVPQGNNFTEWKECLQQFDLSKISTIGIAKIITKAWNNKLARYICCEYIKENYPKMNIHLLGCMDNINEIKTINNKFNIRSCDTALAYIYTLDNKIINQGDRPNQKINFLKNELNKQQTKLLKENINIFNQLVKHER